MEYCCQSFLCVLADIVFIGFILELALQKEYRCHSFLCALTEIGILCAILLQMLYLSTLKPMLAIIITESLTIKKMSFTLKDLHRLHFHDRNLFARLVLRLRRDLAKSLIIMAFWFSLEHISLPSVSLYLSNSPDDKVNDVANEAITCLDLLGGTMSSPPEGFQIPATQDLIGESIPIDRLLGSRSYSILNIQYFLETVCVYIFTDILYKIIPIEGNIITGSINYGERMLVRGFPDPVFGDLYLTRLNPTDRFPRELIWDRRRGPDDFVDDDDEVPPSNDEL